MSPESEDNLQLEIGHVLFLDIVGYSKLMIDEQKERLHRLTEIVLATRQVATSPDEELVKIPTGDGMALVFRHSSEEPARCALEIAAALGKHPEIAVRMGVHSGPVSEVTDVSGRTNIAGPGINMAQRVMDCGDARHILVSQRVAEDLVAYRYWSEQLHSLGECEVKHGVHIHVFNLYTEEFGNPKLPAKLRQAKAAYSMTGAAARPNDGWIAVLPFKTSGGAEVESFADELGEEITTGLSRFPYLSVVARDVAAQLKGQTGNEQALGAQLGARYVVEGSIRQRGSALRVSARLIDMKSGAQLWGETYDRNLQDSDLFAMQDDVAARVVATVADSYGVLVNSMTAQSASKDDAELTGAEWQCQYFAYRQQITPANHAALKLRLEAALEWDKTRAEIWSCLAQMYVDAYAFGFQAELNDLDRALVAARRGVEFDRTNQFGLVSLAQTYFFRQDLAAFLPAAERAMAINPLNTDALGILGLLIVHTGAFERGATIVRRAMELNPGHAGWMHFAPIWEHFHKGEYEQSLEHANLVDIPGLFWPHLVVAATSAYLGRNQQATAAVRDLLAIDPEFALHARDNISSWHFASGLLEPLLNGLRKAGLTVAEEKHGT